ncbi:sugar phosphate isomerase/epimerase [Armatimonas sp.]|uniref:sugar phosphate isomerase/epimerase family protein n=1 Tax=Armatimonas sp. TaxID=1872638 RepID=UPI00286B7A95|nr:sugar phosphate isomerase/epimerase [Armatimonas sp.]
MISVGFRIPGALGRIPFAEMAAWAAESGFGSIDLGSPNPENVAALKANGLGLGTCDLGGTRDLLSPDEAVQKKGIETCTASLEAMAAQGFTKAFTTFNPPDSTQSRRVSLENWSKSFPEVAKVAARVGVRIAVEGWPGANNNALGVTPETLRAMFAVVPGEEFGINYDPSHLVRIGVDYQRFLREFGGRAIHAHGKDTQLDGDGAYLYGNLGPSLDRPVHCGGGDWRYCIPGEGVVNWAWVLGELQRHGFDDTIAIELEDFRYNGSVEGDKLGLIRAKANLTPYL